MRLNHVGYLVANIDSSAAAFSILGYQEGEVYADKIQQCYICFLTNGTDVIELVQPFEDNAPMQKLLRKHGAGAYHLCYEVDDVERIYEELSNEESWTPLFAPVEAVAFGGRKITYFLNAETGFIEFVEKEK